METQSVSSSDGGKYAVVAFPITLMESVSCSDPDAEEKALELIVMRYKKVMEERCTTKENIDAQLS